MNVRDKSSPDPKALERLRQAKWSQIMPRILLWSHQLHRKYLSNIRAAPEARELAQDAVADLITGKRSLPEDVPITTVLYGILRSKVSNFLNTQRPDALPESYDLADMSEIPDRSLLEDEVRKLVADDEVLLRMIDYLLDDPLIKPRDLAVLMNVPVREINNAQKRLRRKLSLLKRQPS